MGKTLGYGEITVANMTEPFTVMLTNEAQQFATDSNRKVTSAQSYYTDIIVIRGSQERTDYTIGNITSGSGITVSKNSKRVTFSVSAGTTIGADAGVIEIPITLDGQTVKKQFSWSCGKQGPQGVKGQDGNSFSWNLLQDSSFPVGTKKWNLSNGFSVCTDVKYNGYNSIKIVNQEDVRLDVPSTYFSDYTTSQDLYLTFWIMCPDVSKITNSVDSWIGFRKGYVFLPNGAIARKISKDEFEKAGNNNWFKISISAKSDDIESTTCTFMLQPNNSQATFYVACPMLSRGAIEVPYAPHPDDLIGETGKSVSKITEYYLATSASSGVTYSTSGWSTDPTTQKLTTTNKYLWNCKITEYDDGTKSQPTTPVMCGTYGETGKNGADGDSFAWNMLSETNCGKKHWGTESSGGKYSVEDFITEDNINAVKLICTEGISTSNWSYVLFKDIKMLKQLKPSTKYTLSYDIKANRSGAISHSICKGDVSNFCTNTVVVNNIIGNETWQHISVVLTTNDLKTTPTNEILYLGRNALSKVGYSIIKNLKLVEGDIDTPWSPSQSDIEGKGVVETVQYYLATSQASGVTSSTSGWSTDITTQKLTADKKYLWNCYQTKYSDGTSEPISTPKVIGVYGDKGANALQCKRNWTGTYTTINGTALATLSDFNRTPVAGDVFTTLDGSSNTGTWQVISVSGSNVNIKLLSYVNSRGEKGDNAKNLTITPSSQYFKSTDGGKTFAPNTITIKPTIQGEISFGKWQYSIDGGVSFADVVSGQKGLTVSNNVLTVSKDSSLYSDAVTMITFRAVADDSSFYDTCSIAKIYDVSDIGDGRNLLTGVSSYTKDTPFEKTDSRADGWIVYQNIITSIELEAGKKYVLQAKTDGNWTANHDTNGQDPSKKLVTLWLVSDTTNDFFDMRQGYVVFTPTVTAKYKLRVNQYSNGTDAYTIHLWDIKLEKGSSPTGWTPAPEDLQTAILSTKSEISDVSLKVDKNKQAIEQRVEKTTYQQDLNLVKGDINKANEGLNKWRYEIYPKSLFASEYQGKSTMDVFAKNTNLTPSQSVLINDTDLSIAWNYDNNYIGYALTFTKFSAAKSVAITFAHDDGAHIYLNGKLIGGSDAYSQTGESLTLGFVKGWNCIEIVVNEGASTEGFKLGTTISSISECQLMNCYYGTPVARQSHITNQLVENTTNIKGVTTTMQKVMTTVGGSDRIDEFVNNYNKTIESEKQFKKTIGETYTTKDEFNGLEIGGRNLVLDSKPQKQGSSYAVVSRHLSVDLQAGVTYTISFCGRVVDGDGSLVVYLYRNDWKDSIQKSTKSKENTVISWQFTPKINGAFQIEAYSFLSQGVAGGNVYLDWFKVEKGNKATDWTPAPEDNGINGQNLVSNLPANWEQGTFQDSKTNVGCDYNTNKASMTTRIRVKELVPVSGTITISNAYSNQSKKPIQNMITAFDVNKKWLGNSYVSTDWNDFPRIVDMKDAKYIAVVVRYKDESAITPSDISQICLKIERGTSATPFTLAPEDVNGKIVNVETIANQTAKKFEWIVKGESTSSNLVLTDNALTAIANNINLTGKVTFSWLNNETQKKITDANTWVTNNGSSTTSLNSMVKKWTDGAVSDTTQINGGWIKANTITASKIAVGDFTNYADINESNTYGFTVEKTADGVWFSKDGSKLGRDNYISKMYSCEPGQTFYVEYDISNTIKDSTEYKAAGTMLFGCDGTQTVKWYQRRGAVVGTAAGTVTHMSQQLTMPSGTRFFYVVLQIEGHPPFTGTLKIRNLSVRKAVTGAVIVDGSITADKIATDAIKSRNYISSGGTQGSFLNLSDGSFTSPNLSWDSNGNLIAKNANLSGQITATKGSIGGWSVDNYSIYTTYDADQNIFGSGISGTKGKYVLWAGETNNAIGANRSSDTPTDASLVIYNNGGLEVRKTMVGNDKKNHLYTTILQSGQINLKMDDNYIGTITATDTISSNSTVTMSHVSMAAKKGYGWSILHTDDSGNLISDIQRDPGDTKIKIKSPITVSSTDISKYNAIEATGDVVVSGKIHANYGSNKIQLNPDNNGSIELYGYTPFIDFHYGNSDSDYTSRIIAQEWGLQIVGTATVTGDLYCDAHIYTCTNGHFSWAGQTDAYLGCGNYSGGNNIYYYANYHAFYVNNDSGSGMMYINTNGVTSRVGFTKTSDERIKKNFKSFDDNIIDAYMNIEPVKYQLKQSSNDNYHFGFRAQHIDKVFGDYGESYNESFDICTSRPIDPNKAKELYGVDGMTEEYGLRYDELIAPTTYMVQHTYKELESTKNELEQVKQEKADLETRLQAIEAKLGL